MARLIPPYDKVGRLPWPEESHLRAGDWMVLPDEHNLQQVLYVRKKDLAPATVLRIDDPLPLRTIPCYYGGAPPLLHREGPRFSVTVNRVLADFVPTSTPGR
jgi:hypothetical protein